MNREHPSEWNSGWGAVGALIGYKLRGRPVVVAGAEGGVFVSDDGGVSWQPLEEGGGPTAVTSLAAAASGSQYAGSATGFWRFDVEQASWRRLLETHVHAVVMAGSGPDGDWLIAGTELDGAVRSEDGGRTWRSATAGLLDTTVLAMAASPPGVSDRVVLAGTPSGIYVSRNDGKAWRFAALPGDRDDVAVQCLAVSPDWSSSRIAYAGTEDDGLLRTIDGGLSWEHIPHFESDPITAVAHRSGDAVRPCVVVASGSHLTVSSDGGESWRALAETADEVWSLLVCNADQTSVILAGMAAGGVARIDLDE